MNRRRTKNKTKVKLPARPPTPREALRPFANVEIPSGEDGECVWFFVGKPLGTDCGHLTLEDFRLARRALR